MRAPFDNLCTIRFGPTTATPNVARGVNLPCRFVLDQHFVDVDAPLGDSLYYLTIEELLPNGPTITGLGADTYLYDFGKADLVTVLTAVGLVWQVVRVELCTGSPAPYWRAHLRAYEPVPPPSCTATYPDVLEIYDYNFATLTIVTRTSPTTWGGGDWLLEVSDIGAYPGCEGTWTVHHFSNTWVSGPWNCAQGTATPAHDVNGILLPTEVRHN